MVAALPFLGGGGGWLERLQWRSGALVSAFSLCGGAGGTVAAAVFLVRGGGWDGGGGGEVSFA